MYNLLVVDDEMIISKYVAKVLRDSELLKDMLSEVRCAFSAYDALEILEAEHIDIVMTDISMPGMSGIKLQEEIKKNWPNIKVVLMSGYNEFEYVQAALRNNGVDYVLKSEGEEQFVLSVKKAVDELEQERKSEEIIKKAAHNLKLANGLLRERVMEIINNMSPEERKNLAAEIITKGINFENESDVEAFYQSIAERLLQAEEDNQLAGSSKIIEFINSYIINHLDEELSLNKFAELLNYHPSYLSRVFKQEMGISFSDYLTGIRVEKAKELLQQNDLKISAIATMLGFEDASYFTRFFKKNTGMAPLEYRSR
ncbi:MAG TPA: helix-turn-helix domain-containing protein [Clostridiales bacterium]|nr:helix-turn-helix domain-containing protein [Clostridiales bacterium]